jgi:RNase P subunit RPR2
MVTESVEAFTQNLKTEILKRAREQLKEKLESEIQTLGCKKCCSPSYAIMGYPEDNDSILAYLKCQECGDEETVFINSNSVDEGMKGVSNDIRDLQKTIADINKKINKR